MVLQQRANTLSCDLVIIRYEDAKHADLLDIKRNGCFIKISVNFWSDL